MTKVSVQQPLLTFRKYEKEPNKCPLSSAGGIPAVVIGFIGFVEFIELLGYWVPLILITVFLCPLFIPAHPLDRMNRPCYLRLSGL